MVDAEPEPSRERLVRLRTAVAVTVLVGVLVAAGGYVVGWQVGQHDDSGPSADFIYQQRADAVRQIKQATSRLVQIEQNSVQLLVGKSGAQVDTRAFGALRLAYTHVYDAVLAERGGLSQLFDAPVLAAAKQVTHDNNVALDTLYLDPAELPGKTASQISALVSNSHTARKHQWQSLRKFTQAAYAEIDPNG
jgi:hypothetical protein